MPFLLPIGALDRMVTTAPDTEARSSVGPWGSSELGLTSALQISPHVRNPLTPGPLHQDPRRIL